MSDKTRILIVDDSARARNSLRALLAICTEDAEIQEAETGLEALQCIDESSPSVVLMDIMMPGLDGIKTTQIVKQHRPQVKIIALSIACDSESQALAAGADAFVCKGDPPGVLLETLARVAGLQEDDRGKPPSVL
ncbi:MAG: response regulator transcription factor [Acidobacteriota bacterium]